MSVCATWFCKHVRGEVGSRFWDTLRRLLTLVEKDLAFWAAHELGLETKSLRMIIDQESSTDEPELDSFALDGGVAPKIYRDLWRKWEGRETDFYQASSRLVRDLPWNQVLSICGIQATLMSEFLAADFHDLITPTIPEILTLGEFEALEACQSGLALFGYGANDPLQMSSVLLSILPYFDGGRTTDILARIEKERKLSLDEALIQRLLDHGILAAGDALKKGQDDNLPLSDSQ